MQLKFEFLCNFYQYLFVFAELQKDFSVTNRLLPHYNETKDFSKSHSPDVYPSSYPHGWQYLLPTDQGSVSASRPGWQGMVPNATLPRAPYDTQAYRADSTTSYAPVGYTHSLVQNPSVESAAPLAGATTPLHHATDLKDVNAIAPTSPVGDQQRNGNQNSDTRSSSTGKLTQQ